MTDPSDTLRFRARLALRATGLALALLAAPAHPLAACSQGVPWGYLLPRNVPFIGTALGDTLLAGPGAMRPVFAIGHTGRGQPREIFGQRVRVDRMGSRARSAFPAGTTHVVLVPWDFDAGCRTVPALGSRPPA